MRLDSYFTKVKNGFILKLISGLNSKFLFGKDYGVNQFYVSPYYCL